MEDASTSSSSSPTDIDTKDLSSRISKFVDDFAVGKMKGCDSPLSCSAPTGRPTYLQALLGDNPPRLGPFNQAQQDDGELDKVFETDLVSSRLSGLNFSSSYGCEAENLDLALTSTSLTSKRRNRSVSLSALEPSLPFSSPLRTREHTSEAGSPTLEQVLLMRQRPDLATTRDLGYGSVRDSGLAEDIYSCLLYPSLEEVDYSLENNSPRPKLQDIVGQLADWFCSQ